MGIIYSELLTRIWADMPAVREMLAKDDISYHKRTFEMDGAFVTVKHLNRSEWLHGRFVYVDINRRGEHRERFFRISEEQAVTGRFDDEFFMAIAIYLGIEAEESGILTIPRFQERRPERDDEEIRHSRLSGKHTFVCPETAVREHYRNVRCGPGRTQTKLVRIKAHRRVFR